MAPITRHKHTKLVSGHLRHLQKPPSNFTSSTYTIHSVQLVSVTFPFPFTAFLKSPAICTQSSWRPSEELFTAACLHPWSGMNALFNHVINLRHGGCVGGHLNTVRGHIRLQGYRLMFFACDIVSMSVGALILSRLIRAHRRVTRISLHPVTLDTPQTSEWLHSANERVQSSYLLWTSLHHWKLHLSRQRNTISYDFMRNYVPDVIRSPGNINKDLDKHNSNSRWISVSVLIAMFPSDYFHADFEISHKKKWQDVHKFWKCKFKYIRTTG